MTIFNYKLHWESQSMSFICYWEMEVRISKMFWLNKKSILCTSMSPCVHPLHTQLDEKIGSWKRGTQKYLSYGRNIGKLIIPLERFYVGKIPTDGGPLSGENMNFSVKRRNWKGACIKPQTPTGVDECFSLSFPLVEIHWFPQKGCQYGVF